MPKVNRKSYDAAFKLKCVARALEVGNRKAGVEYGVNECMVRRWRKAEDSLLACSKSTKSFRGRKAKFPAIEDELETWIHTIRADGRGVSTVQVRLKATELAREKEVEGFVGGPSWVFRFMKRRGLSLRSKTTLSQIVPEGYEKRLEDFRAFVGERIEEGEIEPGQIVNMDEVPLTFDIPLTRTVNKKGESSVNIRTTGHEKTHFTVVLACTADGKKLPPMVIFKRKTMPKDVFPPGIIIKVNVKGWMNEGVMGEWLTECFSKKVGGFFRTKKSMLVMDSMRSHITSKMKEAVKALNAVPAIIPGGTTKFLQPLDISVNRPFKVHMRALWEKWMSDGEHSFTKTGRMRRATLPEVCSWIVESWRRIKTSTITNGFAKAGIYKQPSTPAEDQPSTPEDQPSTSGEAQPSTSGEAQPSTSGEAQPSTSASTSTSAAAADEDLDLDAEEETQTQVPEEILTLFHSESEDSDFDGFPEDE